MANSFIVQREISIQQQAAAIRLEYPNFTPAFISHSTLKVFGTAQPTSRSALYLFEIRYNLSDDPKVKILSPALRKNSKGESPKHLYKGDYLCLYRPKYREFSRTDFLTKTIIPWTILWLYYYEIWHLTGEWRGGGEHPISKT